MIVCKFGGSSLSSRKALFKVKSILDANKERNIIIASAIGKRNPQDIKLTDLLEIAIEERKHSNFNQIFERLRKKMIDFASELNVNPHLILNFDAFKKQIKSLSVSKDYILSRGEYFTACVCAMFLNAEFIDAKDIIKKDSTGRIDLLITKSNLKSLKPNKRYVIPGFYCSNASNEISLLGRGGSDTTGAIIANCINADLYENYSDVNGLLTIDNKLSSHSKTIKQVNKGQLLNCVIGGASVYCLGAIPFTSTKTLIKNTFNNKHAHTIINKKSSFYFFNSPQKYIVIANKKKALKSLFISGILNYFTKHKISISEAIYSNGNLYLSLKENTCFNYVHGVKLTLYGIYSNFPLNSFKELCKSKDIEMRVIKLPRPALKTNIFFFGKINEEFINEIIYKLENKDTL